MSFKDVTLKLLNEKKFDDFIAHLETVLSKQCVEEALDTLSKNQHHDLWQFLEAHCTSLLMMMDDEEAENAQEVMMDGKFSSLYNISTMALICIKKYSNISPGLRQSAIILRDVLTIFPLNLSKLRHKIFELCEAWWNLNCPERGNFAVHLMLYLFEVIKSNHVLKADVKRILALDACFKSIHFGSEYGIRLKKAIQTVTLSHTVLQLEEGRKLLGRVLCLEENLMKELHKEILHNEFANLSRVQAKRYGEVYFRAWNSANTEQRQIFEKHGIQEFMYYGVHVSRSGPDATFSLFKSFLEYFHQQKKVTEVRAMLCRLYQPILWRSLKAANCEVRANAAEIFFDAFPFEDPQNTKQENDLWLESQFQLMKDLIEDSYPSIRIQAISGIVNVCNVHWELIPSPVIRKFLIKILELTSDVSSWEVRAAVIKNLCILLDNNLSWPCLKHILPKLKNSFHDTSSHVRLWVVELLLKVKNLKILKPWDIVSVPHLLGRLIIDEEFIAKRIVQLLLYSFLPDDKSDLDILERSISLIDENPEASVRFFYFAHEFKSLEKSVKILLIFGRCIGSYTNKKLNENKIPDSFLSDAGNDDSNNKENVDNSATSGNSYPLDNPAILEGIFNVIGTFWTGIRHRLQKEENSELNRTLVKQYKDIMPLLFKYFKNTIVWEAILYIASLMKSSYVAVFNKHCLARLRELTNLEDGKMIVYSLCQWHSVNEMIEVFGEWLQAALNKTTPPAKRRSKKVHFDGPNESQPTLACELVCWILEHPVCRHAVLHQENALKSCWDSLFSVLNIIKERLKTRNSPANIYCNDVFLEKAFWTLCRVNILMKRDDNSEENITNMTQLLDWATDNVLPIFSKHENQPESSVGYDLEELMNFAEKILHALLTTVHDMILINMLNNIMMNSFQRFAVTALQKAEEDKLVPDITSAFYQLLEYVFSRSSTEITTPYKPVARNLYSNILNVCMKQSCQENGSNNLMSKLKYTLMDSFNVVFCQNSKSDVASNMIAVTVNRLVEDICQTISQSEHLEDVVNNLSKFTSFFTSLLISKQSYLNMLVNELHRNLFSKVVEKSEQFLAVVIILHYIVMNTGSTKRTKVANIIKDCLKEAIVLLCICDVENPKSNRCIKEAQELQKKICDELREKTGFKGH